MLSTKSSSVSKRSMGYYKVKLATKCEYSGCDRRATHAIHTSGTVKCGNYCTKCTDRLIKKWNKENE